MNGNGNGVAPGLEKLQELRAVLPARKRVLIIPHNYPDPDALASAAAVHLLLDRYFGVHSQIVFSGAVSRAENKELLRRLRYRWHLLADVRLPRRGVPCILVDTAPWSKNVTLPEGAKPVAVFDHHEHVRTSLRPGVFADIRPEAGSTTTIVHEYVKAAGVPIPRWLAAIMAYAIASETQDLSRESVREDRTAFVELASRADLRIIGKIRHAPLPRAYFVRLQEAITNARKLDNLVWSHLESIEQPEIAAEVADLLLRMEGVQWSFCTANLGGGLFVSLRSNRRGARCGKLLSRLIGRSGSAGGHDSMAAGYLELSDLEPDEREERRQTFIRSLLQKISRRYAADAGSSDALVQPLVGAQSVE
jgi:nanoRNase/pAp phosphatase (c-di-AMP/oligoRNAs hydrolase)